METQTSDTKFTSTVNKLFAPKQALQYIEPVDYPITSRKTTDIEPISEFFDSLKEYDEKYKLEVPAVPSTIDQKQAEKAKKDEERKRFIQEKFAHWNPEEDKHISGDPYRTVFIGRLDYSVDEVELSTFFTNYGEIEKTRVVRDKNTSESKGYAFILFKNESDARLAYQRGNGISIKNRKCIVDMERGRSVKNWKPRWLGGGLGGRDISKGKIAKTKNLKDRKNGDKFEKQQIQLKKELEEETYEPLHGARNQMFAPPNSYNRPGRGGRERSRGGPHTDHHSHHYPAQNYSNYRPKYANNGTNSATHGHSYSNNRRY